MSGFAGKVSSGRRRLRWWIVVLAAVAAVPFAAGVPARAATPVVQWTPYSGSDQFTDDGRRGWGAGPRRERGEHDDPPAQTAAPRRNLAREP
jgi:hypothetical protein